MKNNTKEASTKHNSRKHATHFTHSTHFLTRANAFTLAETLITLAIIGVVAAITVPSLIQGYKKKEYSTKLKKFYSTMQQTIQMSTVTNGAIDYWDKKEIIHYEQIEDEEEREQALATNIKNGVEFVSTYILPYMKYLKIEENQPVEINSSGETINMNKIYLNDGSTFYVYNGDCIDIFYDVNGDKAPNKVGYDIYRFLFAPQAAMRNLYFATEKQYFGPRTEPGARTTHSQNYREYVHNLCVTDGKFCTELLNLDNWEYTEDYPYKL